MKLISTYWSILLIPSLVMSSLWAQTPMPANAAIAPAGSSSITTAAVPPAPGQLTQSAPSSLGAPQRNDATNQNSATATAAAKTEPSVTVRNDSRAAVGHSGKAKWLVLAAVAVAAGAGLAMAGKSKSSSATATPTPGISIGAPTVSVGHP